MDLIYKECVKYGIGCARKWCVDVDIESIGKGAYVINKWLQATKAITGASVFDPKELYKMTVENVKVHLQLLIDFSFITWGMIDNAINDADSMCVHAIRNSKLLDINILNHGIMMKLNEVK